MVIHCQQTADPTNDATSGSDDPLSGPTADTTNDTTYGSDDLLSPTAEPSKYQIFRI